MAKPDKKQDDAISLKGGGSNSQAIIAGYITELVKAEDELERMSAPIKAHIKDIKASAKAAKANIVALTNAVKFKRASEKGREKFQQEAADTDLYLSFIQLNLFA